MKDQFVKVDSRGRICLTKILKDMPPFFCVSVEEGKVILESIQEIPESGHWLFEPENRELLEKLKASLKDTERIDRGSFLKYLKD